jgi:hypothetical protein
MMPEVGTWWPGLAAIAATSRHFTRDHQRHEL